VPERLAQPKSKTCGELMKIHEYQAKNLFKKYNIPVQDGVIIDEIQDLDKALNQVENDLGAKQYVIKAQVHAGGRGKGGGVKFCPNRDAAVEHANNILGMQLITPQTTSEGVKVRKIMVGEAIDIAKEYYVAITLDRSVGKDVLMVSTEGGVEIEEVAAATPEKIVKEWVEPKFGLLPYQARNLAMALGLEGQALKSTIKLLINLYQCYEEIDGAIVEINPLVLTDQGDVLALDGKINIDDNALYRQPDIAAMRDLHEEDPAEVEASKSNLSFIKLDGTVGCMVNGAGLAMATMDIIKLHGGDPANFLDVGGGANVETVKNAFKIILSDKNVKAVLINIFGGIVRCDRVAGGILEAVKGMNLEVPVVVRLAGTNAEEAKEMLAQSDVDVIPALSLAEAAEKVVAASK
jgi:succinyl-CoA synthetase beta subunit